MKKILTHTGEKIKRETRQKPKRKEKVTTQLLRQLSKRKETPKTRKKWP